MTWTREVLDLLSCFFAFASPSHRPRDCRVISLLLDFKLFDSWESYMISWTGVSRGSQRHYLTFILTLWKDVKLLHLAYSGYAVSCTLLSIFQFKFGNILSLDPKFYEGSATLGSLLSFSGLHLIKTLNVLSCISDFLQLCRQYSYSYAHTSDFNCGFLVC